MIRRPMPENECNTTISNSSVFHTITVTHIPTIKFVQNTLSNYLHLSHAKQHHQCIDRSLSISVISLLVDYYCFWCYHFPQTRIFDCVSTEQIEEI